MLTTWYLRVARTLIVVLIGMLLNHSDFAPTSGQLSVVVVAGVFFVLLTVISMQYKSFLLASDEEVNNG